MRTTVGFSLIELLIVVALVGIGSSIALGPLVDLIRDQRIKTGATDLYASLVAARAEAVKRNSCVRLVPNSSSNWNQGWSIQITMNGTQPACGGSSTALVTRTIPAFDRITIAGPSGNVEFRGSGQLTVLGDMSSSSLCINTCSSSCTVSTNPPGFLIQAPNSSTVRCVGVLPSGAPMIKRN